MKEDIAKKHEHCQMSVRWKSIKGKQDPRPGLFCQAHDVYLDWLTPKVAFDLIDSQQVIEELWIDRKKNKPKPSESKVESNYLKTRQKKKKKFKKVSNSFEQTYGRKLPR